MLPLLAILLILNLLVLTICFKASVRAKSPFATSFCILWGLHYLLGNAAVLLNNGTTFGIMEFEELENSYLLANLSGLYFLAVYISLSTRTITAPEQLSVYPARAFAPLMAFFVLACLFAVILMLKIGVGSYFSAELAQHRNRLGAYAGEGIGYFYYPALLLMPSTALLCSYAIDRRAFYSTAIAGIALLCTLIFFAPFGGRGRTLTVAFIVLVAFLLRKRDIALKGLISKKALLAWAAAAIALNLWAGLRSNWENKVDLDYLSVIRGLQGDLTRMQFQAYIFHSFPFQGTFFGLHYLQSILGPFTKFTGIGESNLISVLSLNFYYDTLGIINRNSAISPSFIGEAYLNFGLVGIAASPFMLFGVTTVAKGLFKSRSPSPLALAIVIYLQLMIFHGGLYNSFQLLFTWIPALYLDSMIAKSNAGFAYGVRHGVQSKSLPTMTRITSANR
jgi:hypothetical protein